MIYLTTPPTLERLGPYRDLGLGVMVTPRAGNRIAPEWRCWAADNGCFAETSRGDVIDEQAWAEWLAAQPPAACLFAAAPDVMADAAATWARSAPWLPRIRELGYPAALVAQNGFDVEGTDWAAFDVLFLGGDDAFKLGRGFDLVAEARARGKWVHVGRVNSRRRWAAFDAVRADSCDGNLLKYGPDVNMRRVRSWLAQPTLRLP